jgi:hypothetical protein
MPMPTVCAVVSEHEGRRSDESHIKFKESYFVHSPFALIPARIPSMCRVFSIKDSEGGDEDASRGRDPIPVSRENPVTLEEIRRSTFYANYGFEANELTRTIEVLADNPGAALTATELREMHANSRLDLMFCRQQMTKYAHHKRLEGLTLKRGGKVYLLRRNIRSDKPT